MAEAVDGTTPSLVLVSAAMVFLTTIPGLALFYGSLVSRKNLIDTMLQSVILTGTIPIMWWLVAYSLCFGSASHPIDGFIGSVNKATLQWDEGSVYGGIDESAWCVFQLTFAVLTAAIATGAAAERALLWPLVVFANLWLLLVYCPICHMVWGDGLLMRWGVLDTAGGLVVETCSGVTALVLCYFLGPRRHPTEDADPVRAVLHIVGAALLWVGWLLFNGGLAFTSEARASTTVLNTLLAGSAGGLGWIGCAALGSCKSGMTHLAATVHFMGGAVAGLCAATPSSGFVTPTGSVLIGLGAGALCFLADEKLKPSVLKPWGIDDVVSMFPVHGMGGLWGTLMTGVLAVDSVGGTRGAIQGNWSQVAIQAVSILVVVAWTAVMTALLMAVISRVAVLRAEPAEEMTRLDSRPHGQKSAQKAAKFFGVTCSSADDSTSPDDLESQSTASTAATA